jgi:uncharacterized membrane protein YqjE
MSANPPDVAAATSTVPRAEETAPGGILAGLSGTFTSAHEVLVGFFDLFSLEARRAGTSLMWMVACGVLAAMLFVSTWLGLMAAVALYAVSQGVSWPAAVAAVALTNLLAAVLVMLACKKMSRDLLFPATRRQFESKPDFPE